MEEFPDVEKRPDYTQFLKDARPVADKAVKLMVDGRISELYSANKAALAKAHTTLTTEEAFQKEVAEMVQNEGKILAYEFRGQNITVLGPPKNNYFWSAAIYAVKTTKWTDNAFLDVRTEIVGNEHLVYSVWLEHLLPDDPERFSFGKTTKAVCQDW